MGRISASSCRVGELDLETVRLVRAYLAARAGGDVPDARWIEAWDRFYTACDPLVRRFARCRCHNASDIDDRVQEVWLAVAAHFLQYDPQRGPFQNWFTVLIRSVLAQQHRSHRPLRQLDDESEERIASREADPTVLCDQVQRRRRVRSAIEELCATTSQTNYRILYDHWIEGKCFAEIAKSLGLTAKRVRDRHSRAIDKLRELLRPRR